MDERELMEKLRSEAESVEVPPELEPDQIRARIEQAGESTAMEQKSARKQRKFHWSGWGGKAAAAAVVLVASLGAFGVANSQTIAPVKGDAQVADSAAESVSVSGQAAVKEQALQEDVQAVATEADEPEPVRTLGDYRLADSYEEVCEMLNGLEYLRGNTYGLAEGAVADLETGDAIIKGQSVLDSASGMLSGATANATGISEQQKQNESIKNTDYSTTNLQVTGVDESDIVKTDGRYIYIATDDKVQIVDTQADTPLQMDSIEPEFSGNMDRICEMYVSDGRLLLIAQTEDTDGLEQVDPDDYVKEEAMVDVAYWPWAANSVHTQVLTYDITDPAGAKLVGTFMQDGSYNSSRKIGDQLYLFTDYGYPVIYPYSTTYLEKETDAPEDAQSSGEETTITEEDVKDSLPQIQGETIPEDCIYLPKDGTESGVLMASVDVKEPEQATDQKLIFSGYSTLYVTQDSIILYCTDYDMTSDSQRTKLTRFAIDDGRILADCAESVPGSIEDTFAIHENEDGYLYVLTTDYTENGNTNQLFVLDERLKIHGKIEHIADGESVYAARFVDDIGYFVTYRNMDPLFTVDFSDPAKPTLIGELEIPGFSDYLQFWDDTHLIGVGEARKEKDSEFVGIKLSLYDISDPTSVKESAKFVMKDACYAPAQYNYKALLADSGKNVIAFLTDDKGEDGAVSQRIFTVEGGELKAVVSDCVSKGEWNCDTDSYRNLYIGDRLYLVREGLIIVYDMANGFVRIATCKLN